MTESKKGVLILEDNALLLDQLAESCREIGFCVYDCHTIYEAKNVWSEHQLNIHAIVTDTNMDPLGLKKEEILLSKDGKFSGWLWVNNYVIANGFQPEKVIILSEYNRDLYSYIRTSTNDRHKSNYETIKKKKHLIDKVDPSGATKKLLKILREL